MSSFPELVCVFSHQLKKKSLCCPNTFFPIKLLSTLLHYFPIKLLSTLLHYCAFASSAKMQQFLGSKPTLCYIFSLLNSVSLIGVRGDVSRCFCLFVLVIPVYLVQNSQKRIGKYKPYNDQVNEPFPRGCFIPTGEYTCHI